MSDWRNDLKWIEPLGWMLLHSVWMIGAIAGVYWLIDSVLRSRSPNARYWCGSVALILSIISLPIGYWYAPPPGRHMAHVVADPGRSISGSHSQVSPQIELTRKPVIKVSPDAGPVSLEQDLAPVIPSQIRIAQQDQRNGGVRENSPFETIPATGIQFNLWTRVETTLRPFLPSVVLVWLIGVLLFSLRPALGWMGIRRLLRVGLMPVPAVVNHAVKQLSHRLKITRTVNVLQSVLVDVPCVIGALRPMILLPVNVVTGLSSDQLNAVLAHELAHVRRHDFVMNAIQSFIETLLFFHPAIWWLSSRVRQERENCCDDIAVALCGDVATYARMLMTIDQLRGQVYQPVLAASGGSLVKRIRRLIPTAKEDVRSPWPVAVALVLVLLIVNGVCSRPIARAAVIESAPATDRPSDQPTEEVRNDTPQVEPAKKQASNPGTDLSDSEVEQIKQDMIQLRELGQKYLMQASYQSMIATYTALCELPFATVDDYMWLGHAHQLARNWRGASQAYHQALDHLDAQMKATEIQLKEFEDGGKIDESILLVKGSKYPFLKRDQEQLPKQWPDLVLQIGLIELVELKDFAAAAKTLSLGLRFAPELTLPLDQLQVKAEAVAQEKQTDHRRAFQALSYIVPLETQRFLALAQEQLEQPGDAFDTWCRVRLCKMIHPMSYAGSESAHLKELASKLPQDSLKPHHLYVLKHPDREPVPPRDAKDYLNQEPENPFHATQLPRFDFTASGPAAANLVKFSDGRMMLAYATGDHYQTRIKLSRSKEDGSWEEPWEFAHNNIFNTRAPSLVVDDTGEIWMLCLSQRLTTQRFASAPYQLWLTHSRNGREWSPLRPLLLNSELTKPTLAASQYQELPQLMRLPGSRFGIVWRENFSAANSPAELTSLKALSLQKNDGTFLVSNTCATFESDGKCHLVFDDFGRGLYYTRSTDMQTWSPLRNLGLAEKNSSISNPQLLLEGEQVAMIYEQNNGSWLRRGTITEEGLNLGPATLIADHRMTLSGSRLRLDGDRILLPAGGHPYIPVLLAAKFTDLLPSP